MISTQLRRCGGAPWHVSLQPVLARGPWSWSAECVPLPHPPARRANGTISADVPALSPICPACVGVGMTKPRLTPGKDRASCRWVSRSCRAASSVPLRLDGGMNRCSGGKTAGRRCCCRSEPTSGPARRPTLALRLCLFWLLLEPYSASKCASMSLDLCLPHQPCCTGAQEWVTAQCCEHDSSRAHDQVRCSPTCSICDGGSSRLMYSSSPSNATCRLLCPLEGRSEWVLAI